MFLTNFTVHFNMTRLSLIIILLLGSIKPCAALQITFKESAKVKGAVVTLGDIVRFDETSELTKALATQKVAQAPPPGESISLRSLSIKQYLVNNLSLSEEIAWDGSPSVTLSRTGINFGSTKIQRIITEYLEQNSADLPDAEIRFLPSPLPLPFTLPAGKLTYEVIPSNPGILGSSRFSIIFRIDGRVAKNMSVKGRLEALAPVVVVIGKQQKGTILTANNLSLAVKDLSKLNGPGLNVSDFIGKKLKRSLRAGSPLYAAMVEARSVIKRGERVKIVINYGAMHISAIGIARTNGIQNEMIRVQNINTNKIVYCRVAAPGLVEVLL